MSYTYLGYSVMKGVGCRSLRRKLEEEFKVNENACDG